MGLKLYPGKIKIQSDSIIQGLESDNQGLISALQTISQFTQNSELKGAAWESMKGQLGNHEAVIKGIICANDSVIQGHETLKGAVGDEELIEDELVEKRDTLIETNIFLGKSITIMENCLQNPLIKENYSFWYWKMISQYQSSINQNQQLIDELNEKIQKLYDIENGTSSLFTEANALYEAVNEGISIIRKSWNPSISGFTLTSANSEWKKKVEKSWEKVEEREIKRVQKKLEQDYKEGKIDYDTYTSIKSGLLSTGMAFVRESLMSTVQEQGADIIADGIHKWFLNNTTVFMDRGLVAAVVGGGNYVVRETPPLLSQAIRTGSKYAAPVIGTLIDFTVLKVQGESNVDATVKAVTHTGIGIGAAKLGSIVGTALGGPIGTVVGAGVGFVLGVGLNMAFDFIYDNKEKIVEKAVDIVEDIGAGIGEIFGGIGDVIFG